MHRTRYARIASSKSTAANSTLNRWQFVMLEHGGVLFLLASIGFVYLDLTRSSTYLGSS